MIIVEISSGLGNQMFRYAAARALSLRNNNKLYLSLNRFKKDNKRNYSLRYCNIASDVQIVPPILYYFTKIVNKISKIFSFINPEKLGIYYIDNICQSLSYFKDFQDIIKEELKITTPISSKNEITLHEIISTPDSVCLHIRRGDYLNVHNSQIYMVCTEQYYRNAISIIKKKLSNPTFFVFSEDIEWVKGLHLNGNIRYIEEGNPDYEELKLMYNCKHFIISNSTFSWWAQYLSSNTNKIVIAPDHWLNCPNSPTDIYQDNWIKLSTK